MVAIIMLLALVAAVPAPVIAGSIPWAFEIDFKRFEGPHCSDGMIGETTSIEQNDCQSWKDEIPFNAFSYCVSGCSSPSRSVVRLSNNIPISGIPIFLPKRILNTSGTVLFSYGLIRNAPGSI